MPIMSQTLQRVRKDEPSDLPPHSIEAEQGLLGCMMLDSTIIGDAVVVVHEEMFYDLRHRTIFSAIVDLHEDQAPVDIISVVELLRARRSIDAAGGVEHLASLQDAPPSAANWPHYADIIRDHHALRQVIQVSADTQSQAMASPENVREFLDDVGRRFAVVADAFVVKEDRPIKAVVHAVIEQIEAAVERGGTIPGQETGLVDLDKYSNGLIPRECIILAARPSVGKSALAATIAMNLAVRRNVPVAFFSMEMPEETLVRRIASGLSSVPHNQIVKGDLNQGEFNRLTTAFGQISKSPLRILYRPGMTVLEFRSAARRSVKQHGAKLIVVDYIQLMASTSRKVNNRQEEVAEISRSMQQISRETGVTVMALSQLNRLIERDHARKPRLSDLRESGAIEQDADQVWMLYRIPDDKNDERENVNDAHRVGVELTKNRNGQIGGTILFFNTPFVRYDNASMS